MDDNTFVTTLYAWCNKVTLCYVWENNHKLKQNFLFQEQVSTYIMKKQVEQ